MDLSSVGWRNALLYKTRVEHEHSVVFPPSAVALGLRFFLEGFQGE